MDQDLTKKQRKVQVRLTSNEKGDYWSIAFWAPDELPLSDTELLESFEDYLKILQEAVANGD